MKLEFRLGYSLSASTRLEIAGSLISTRLWSGSVVTKSWLATPSGEWSALKTKAGLALFVLHQGRQYHVRTVPRMLVRNRSNGRFGIVYAVSRERSPGYSNGKYNLLPRCMQIRHVKKKGIASGKLFWGSIDKWDIVDTRNIEEYDPIG